MKHKQKIKLKKLQNQKELENFQKNIKIYSTLTYIPNLNNRQNVNNHSWYDHYLYPQNVGNIDELLIPNYDPIIEHDGFYTKTYELFPTQRQELILNNYLKCYTLMYNKTIKYFKTCQFNKQKPEISIKKLKEGLKNEKTKILEENILTLESIKIKTPSHILDYAINDAIKMRESCLSNLKAGNIKHFRLRYLKLNRTSQIFKIEKISFTSDAFYKRTLGHIKMKNDLMKFNNLITMSTVRKDTKHNKYYLQLKYKQKYNLMNHVNDLTKVIGIDPGVRTFLTGYGDREVEEIGKNCSNVISKKLIKIDKINNSTLEQSKNQK